LVPFGIASRKQITPEQREIARNLLCIKHQIAKDAKIILFMGTLDYEPNVAAVKRIIKDIIPGIR
jgi:hypothetical protein